ncbi:hypothetical protein HYPSUDRAFT_207118 [Hypholoma sublateritium FD-334 SS-4]|uniref:Uncharacterized protein n=1 Tax=Hypholoma sublateritium (strain FD-334 SS-4) TaxID=945553 RepID=A0A0D2P7H1_HYPSF|nr:hypothetical protein HYPSUDRAFT_207118 [Hypholoma sublateritium FD-334 SS-4]
MSGLIGTCDASVILNSTIMSEFTFALPGAKPHARATLKRRKDAIGLGENEPDEKKIKRASKRGSTRTYSTEKGNADGSPVPDQPPVTQELIPTPPTHPFALLDDPNLYQMDGNLVDADLSFVPACDLMEANTPSLPPPAAGVYAERPPGPIATEILPGLGVAIDPRSPFAVWGNGDYLTRLPYIPAPNKPDVNALKILSAHLKELIPNVRDARGSGHVDYYVYDDYTSAVDLGVKIKESIASGRFAVVEGCPDMHKIELTLSDMMESLHIQPSEIFQVHDSLLRESKHQTPQISMPLSKFVENLKDPNTIQAILDSPYGTGQHPRLIGHVDEGYIAADKARGFFKHIPYDLKASRVWTIKHHPLFHTFQPPNAWHEVFTPSMSVTIGGHFFTFDTIHLSDVARHFDHKKPGTTNQHHTSSQLIMCAMVTQMVHLGTRPYFRKPLTSLCAMVLRPQKYLSPEEDGDGPLLAQLSAYFKVSKIDYTVPSPKKVPKGDPSQLPTVAKMAIWGALFLVEHFCLDPDNSEHLFQPMPWYAPGDELLLTEENLIKACSTLLWYTTLHSHIPICHPPRSKDPKAPIATLLCASLAALPPTKPCLVTETKSPHKVLCLITAGGAGCSVPLTHVFDVCARAMGRACLQNPRRAAAARQSGRSGYGGASARAETQPAERATLTNPPRTTPLHPRASATIWAAYHADESRAPFAFPCKVTAQRRDAALSSAATGTPSVVCDVLQNEVEPSPPQRRTAWTFPRSLNRETRSLSGRRAISGTLTCTRRFWLPHPSSRLRPSALPAPARRVAARPAGDSASRPSHGSLPRGSALSVINGGRWETADVLRVCLERVPPALVPTALLQPHASLCTFANRNDPAGRNSARRPRAPHHLPHARRLLRSCLLFLPPAFSAPRSIGGMSPAVPPPPRDIPHPPSSRARLPPAHRAIFPQRSPLARRWLAAPRRTLMFLREAGGPPVRRTLNMTCMRGKFIFMVCLCYHRRSSLCPPRYPSSSTFPPSGGAINPQSTNVGHEERQQLEHAGGVRMRE